MQESMIGAVGEVEGAVGVPRGFLWKLANEDDWTFVIKLHALVEAALTHLLTVASHRETLDKVYALLDTSDTKRGKLAFAREMGLLGENYRRYVVSLSQVRNKFIHDVRNVGSTLETYVASLDPNQRSTFVRDVSLGYDRSMEVGGKKIPLQQFVRENPKYGFWLGAMDLLSDIYIQKERVSLEARYSKFARELADASHRHAIAPLLIKQPGEE